MIASHPEFETVFENSPSMRDYLYNNQYQQESDVINGVIYENRHSGGLVENGFDQVLQETMKKFDSRFSQGVSPYWTLQIRIARKNIGSKWHHYANSLPVGIQTIKWRKPKKWLGRRVMAWSDVQTSKVIVY